ncbi:lymphocyte antigen 6L [Erinaceus europaeus]|uniref:Lymphocyte antigen 6L n=1 Tax=Erinaceus europaeus TaxID=9365 RepID=A0ABM3XSG5_ERIEU|nr:lymphocyte antigen 6L [Erinaceus europaeus]
MEGLAPVLWALLVSAEFAGGYTEPEVFRVGGCCWLQRSPLRGCPTGGNLTCFQCFKVTSFSQCTVSKCEHSDHVCISNTIVFTYRTRSQALIVKSCAPRCPNTNSKYEWIVGADIKSTIIRACCSKSLCNQAPTTLEGPWAQRLLLLHMGLGLLWALL